MEVVKKSIYLDAELDLALRESAQRDGRSVTKQLDHLLRLSLLEPETPPVTLWTPGKRSYEPDPRSKSSKKLT